MERINPEKLIDELGKAIAVIDLDESKEGTVSNIIDRAARSTFALLMVVLKGATEEADCDSVIELKKKVVKLQLEIIGLKKKQGHDKS